MYSGYHYDILEHSWNPGKHTYDLDTFATSTTGYLFTKDTFSRYSDLTSMGVLYADTAFFAILAWYFDNIVSSNRGRAKSPLFPIYSLINLFKKEQEKPRNIGSIVLRSKPIGQ